MNALARTALLLFLSATALPAAANDEEWRLDPGGAVRFGYGWLDYAPTSRLQPELVRLDLDGQAGPVSGSLQYRWYDGFDALHHAWVGLRTGQQAQLRLGVQQVPFGLLPTASQSFWFGSGYYLGLEDDYDPGLAWEGAAGPHRWHLGWFTGDEYGDGRRYDRYSFDVATTDTLPYRERGRAHLRYARSIDWHGQLELGASAYAGQVEDVSAGGRRDSRGGALHAQLVRGSVTWQLQWAHYRYDVPGGRIAMSAFQAPFQIAARADVPSFNLAWALPRSGWFDTITCYNNLSATLPRGGAGLDDSWLNVTGCSLGKGPMLAYVDWIAGRDMWFVGGEGVGIDGPGRWRSRLNVNIGFYF